MTDFYAPNQQVVRADQSGPAEEGNGGSQGTPKAKPKTRAEQRAAAAAETTPPPEGESGV